ncbi:tyrosine-type recombinase/integrase [Salinisphaera orenii]|uniref:tyrosine-type recombinase/integrase n=1 Tax=Salinisphaera orenii TaxID=856731 RepID=UPI000DBE1A41
MASINTRNGYLFFDFRYKGVRCREYTKLRDNAVNRKRAEKLLRKMEAEMELGQFDYRAYFPESDRASRFDSALPIRNSPLFEDFADEWFRHASVGYRDSQQKTVRTHIDIHLAPFFRNKSVTRIKKADVLALRTHLASLPGRGGDRMSASAINHVLSSLNQIMADAAERYDVTNPCDGVKRLRVPKTEVHPFSMEEVRLILDHVRPDFHDYYTVRFFTGMRTAEIHGLKWKHVDFERREILIRETLVNGQTESTKTDGSEREIHMSEPVYQALHRQQQATGSVSEYVFCTRKGTPLSNNNVTKRVWYPLLRHLGLRKRRAYQTRHTAATLWLAAGENPEWIARQMGHTSTEMLFRVYSRYVPNLTRRDGSAFERLLTNVFDEKREQGETP